MLNSALRLAFILALFFVWLGVVFQARAQNQVFLSNSLASSKATYVIQFDTTLKGKLDRFQVASPPGLLAGDAPGSGRF